MNTIYVYWGCVIYVYIYIYIYKSDLTDKRKYSCRVDTTVWMHYLDANKTAGEEARRQLFKNVAGNTEQVLAATPHKAPTIRPPASHHRNYPSQTNQTCRTQLEKQVQAHKGCTPLDPHVWPSKSSYVRIWDIALKKWRERVRDICASGTTSWWWWYHSLIYDTYLLF